MAPRRPGHTRFTRRQRRLLRLARTATAAATLVAGGAWWAQDEAPPSGPLRPVAAQRQQPAAPATPAPGAAAGAAGGRAVRPAPAPTPKPPPPTPPPAPLGPSPAARLAIPAITIEAPVIGLGLDETGRLRSPPVDDPRLVGWYDGGPTPGEKGTAVAVGHRDTRTGAAVFLDIHSLKRGNTVRVTRLDGRTAVFTVDRVRTYTKDKFPDKEVYGPTGRPELRLLTCGGAFDPKKGYDANVVVFAHLAEVLPAGVDQA
ncbi:class F sortase [Streptomyces sp. DH12]|uniref:class F sortase n=1 Tax=Streptomyces sp. DH12 TaxID=2857010 RepID=UPI001E51488F|nr:class F sortase [Streptomyces sp. DH12]